MSNAKMEIERKFLIKMIDLEKLRKSYFVRLKEVHRLEQVYLTSSAGERRIRKSVESSGNASYFYTEKVPVDKGLKRRESENEITADEYQTYLNEADPDRKPICKTRYVFDFKGYIFELDIYDFSSDLAILEVEFPTEDTKVELPEFIELVREVTYDKAYKNFALAKSQTLNP